MSDDTTYGAWAQTQAVPLSHVRVVPRRPYDREREDAFTAAQESNLRRWFFDAFDTAYAGIPLLPEEQDTNQ